MAKTVRIQCFQHGAGLPPSGYAAVAIDVIRATTSAVTAVAMGRRCFPVTSVEAALELSGRLENALLVGEQGGNMPEGFELNNSPAAIALRLDVSRPMVMLSSSGTQLLDLLSGCPAAYVACFRNYRSLAEHLARTHEKVSIIGAGTRGEFREEDQMCAAWIAEMLAQAGFAPEDTQTAQLIGAWSGAAPNAFLTSKSVAYLRASNQLKDLDFILAHFDDVNAVCTLQRGEILLAGAEELAVTAGLAGARAGEFLPQLS